MDYLQQNLSNLTSIMDSIIRREVDCSIDDMLKSERLFIAGSENSTRMREDFSDKANKTGIYTQVLSVEKEIPILNDLDVLICISKYGEEQELTNLAEIFKREGARVISITDRRSTLAKYSNRIIGIDCRLEKEDLKKSLDMLFNQSVYILLGSIGESLNRRVSTKVMQPIN